VAKFAYFPPFNEGKHEGVSLDQMPKCTEMRNNNDDEPQVFEPQAIGGKSEI